LIREHQVNFHNLFFPKSLFNIWVCWHLDTINKSQLQSAQPLLHLKDTKSSEHNSILKIIILGTFFKMTINLNKARRIACKPTHEASCTSCNKWDEILISISRAEFFADVFIASKVCCSASSFSDCFCHISLIDGSQSMSVSNTPCSAQDRERTSFFFCFYQSLICLLQDLSEQENQKHQDLNMRQQQ